VTCLLCAIRNQCRLWTVLYLSLHFHPSEPVASLSNMVPTDKSILEWDEGDVQAWLTTLGYSQYESQIRGRLPPLLRMQPVLSAHHQNITFLAMFYAYSTRKGSRRSVSLPLANVSPSSRRCTYSKSPTMSQSRQTITFHLVSSFAGHNHFLYFIFGAAEAQDRQENITLDKLHNTVRDQGSFTF
jgi:hypothetical protein